MENQSNVLANEAGIMANIYLGKAFSKDKKLNKTAKQLAKKYFIELVRQDVARKKEENKFIQDNLNELQSRSVYIPRVVNIKYKTSDGKERIKIENPIPYSKLEHNIMKDMQRLSYQINKGLPNSENLSARKHPRLTNNSKKYTRRHRNNIFSYVLAKPLHVKRLNKQAIQLIKNGATVASLRNTFGRIDKRYTKTVLIYPKQISDKKYGLK
ncbi:MAG: hypothetical protein ACK53T_07970 [Planctomycetota bacterium]|jgi:hypothetical protein